VALFAPCCIVFLAPSYLAAAVKNRRWRLLPLAFVFAAGLALVLVPITLGVGLVAATVARYHAALYYAGGVLMLVLAGLALSGRMWSLPSFLRAPDTARGDSASFFALGVFSGVASSCCAPVLAGVMTLSALSGSPVGAVALGLAYVLGMTFPLLLMALGWDRLRLGERRWARARPVRLRLAGRTLVTNTGPRAGRRRSAGRLLPRRFAGLPPGNPDRRPVHDGWDQDDAAIPGARFSTPPTRPQGRHASAADGLRPPLTLGERRTTGRRSGDGRRAGRMLFKAQDRGVAMASHADGRRSTVTNRS
jgi:cytochrome c biogenesis protein CcdA